MAEPLRGAERFPPGWWTNTQTLYLFASHLVEDEGFSVENLLEFLEKPWKWNTEYQIWKAENFQPYVGKRVSGDTGYIFDPTSSDIVVVKETGAL